MPESQLLPIKLSVTLIGTSCSLSLWALQPDVPLCLPRGTAGNPFFQQDTDTMKQGPWLDP